MRGTGKETRLVDLKQRWRNVRPEVLSGMLYHMVRIVGKTLRVEKVNFPENLEAHIFTGWHGRSFVYAHLFSHKGYWVIISQSRDGDIQNSIFSRLGYQTIRGSTGRGGVRAAIEGIRALKAGGTMAMTPDGPRGPSGVVQGGVMMMAQKSGAALLPVGISARPRIIAKTWDRYLFPMPFARAIIIAGEPIYVPKDSTEEQVEAIRLHLEQEMHRLEAEAEAALIK